MSNEIINVDPYDARLLIEYIDKINSKKRGFANWEKKGRTNLTFCVSPNHFDQHASMVVSSKDGKGQCHCFSCGFHGNLPKLIYLDKFSQKENETSEEINANIKSNYRSILKVIQAFASGVDISKVKIEEYKSRDKKNYKFLYRKLIDSNSFATEYLASRGISEGLTKNLGILKDEKGNIIFPHSAYDYSIRQANAANKNERYMHIGSKTLFNASGFDYDIDDNSQITLPVELGLINKNENVYKIKPAMDKNRPIFVSEGEINAISVVESFNKNKEETNSITSLAMGGVQGTNILLSYLSDKYNRILNFYKNQFMLKKSVLEKQGMNVEEFVENMNFSTNIEQLANEPITISDILQEITPVVLVLDNDAPGIEGSYELSREIKNRFGFEPYIYPLPDKYNDFNDFLIADAEEANRISMEIYNIIQEGGKAALDFCEKNQMHLANQYEEIQKNKQLNLFKNNNKILQTYLYNGVEIYDYIDKNNNRQLGNQFFSFDIKYFSKNNEVSLLQENGEDIIQVKQYSNKYQKYFSTKYKYDFEANETINITSLIAQAKKQEKENILSDHNDEIKKKMIYCEKENKDGIIYEHDYIYPYPEYIADYIIKNGSESYSLNFFPSEENHNLLMNTNGYFIDKFSSNSWNENSIIKKYNDFAKIPFQNQVIIGTTIRQIQNGIGIAPEENVPQIKEELIRSFLKSRGIENGESYLKYRANQLPLSAEKINSTIIQIKESVNTPEVFNLLDSLKNKSFISDGSKYSILDLKLKNGQISCIIRDTSNGYKYAIHDFGKTTEQYAYFSSNGNIELDLSNKKSIYVDSFSKLESKQNQKE